MANSNAFVEGKTFISWIILRI